MTVIGKLTIIHHLTVEVDNQVQVQERSGEDEEIFEKLKAMVSRYSDRNSQVRSGVVGYLACAQRENLPLAIQLTSGLAHRNGAGDFLSGSPCNYVYPFLF